MCTFLTRSQCPSECSLSFPLWAHANPTMIALSSLPEIRNTNADEFPKIVPTSHCLSLFRRRIPWISHSVFFVAPSPCFLSDHRDSCRILRFRSSAKTLGEVCSLNHMYRLPDYRSLTSIVLSPPVSPMQSDPPR